MHRSKIRAYSITSSARSRIEVGMVTPRVLAVLRFTTSWNHIKARRSAKTLYAAGAMVAALSSSGQMRPDHSFI
jgi:hypothetical protein